MGTIVDWSSHLPVLMYAMEHTEGDVLELGGGNFSTPYLHWECYKQGRSLTTYDDQHKYFKNLVNFQNEFHDVILAEDWDDIPIDREWGLAFVDHHPNTRRKEDIRRLTNLARVIVVHDTEEPSYGYDIVYPLFKYRFDFTKTKTNTSVLSNFEDVSQWTL